MSIHKFVYIVYTNMYLYLQPILWLQPNGIFLQPQPQRLTTGHWGGLWWIFGSSEFEGASHWNALWPQKMGSQAENTHPPVCFLGEKNKAPRNWLVTIHTLGCFRDVFFRWLRMKYYRSSFCFKGDSQYNHYKDPEKNNTRIQWEGKKVSFLFSWPQLSPWCKGMVTIKDNSWPFWNSGKNDRDTHLMFRHTCYICFFMTNYIYSICFNFVVFWKNICI